LEFIADLHIHSHYSMATSKQADPEGLARAAAEKGLSVVGTGDFTHPAWRSELKEKLIEAEDGLYKLKGGPDVRFAITGEISSIYKRAGKTRKVHNLLILPDLESAERISKRLEKIGNIHSDGRPILGLDSRDLLAIALEACPDVIFVPAHIWTPHFSLFGANSGFDTIEECFGELASQIFALETGLSSDPAMNWRLSCLDRFALVSNSDAHSPNNLAREANVFSGELSFSGIRRALLEKNLSTLEFFPEEGKYHYDGHRNCKIRWEPEQTIAADGRCPICGKRVTVGVLHRVVELADRPEGVRPPLARPFESLVPLKQILAEVQQVGVNSKKVAVAYQELTRSLGAELDILRKVPIEELDRHGGALLSESIRRMRNGQVDVLAGYDGEYGKVRILTPQLRSEILGLGTLFKMEEPPARPKKKTAKISKSVLAAHEQAAAGLEEPLNSQQEAAVQSEGGPIVVLAGPGTGKTRTLIYRIAYLVAQKGVSPSKITAVTFTNKAADELVSRLKDLLGENAAGQFTVGTFHGIALALIAATGKLPLILDEVDSLEVLAQSCGKKGRALKTLARELSLAKAKGEIPSDLSDSYHAYNAQLTRFGAMDYDDILLRALEVSQEGLPLNWRERFSYLCVDEFQDLNKVQYELVRSWSGAGGGLFVIGDPDQAIYGFRGAQSGFFSQLQHDYPRSKSFALTQNYRSTAVILNAASEVISHNPDRYQLELVPVRSEGKAIRLLHVPSPLGEGIAIAKEIQQLVGGMDMLSAHGQGGISPQGEGGYSFDEIAVCFRTGDQAKEIEKCLLKEGVPYRLVGKKSILESKPAREALALLHFLANPEDDFHLLRLLSQHLSSEELAELKSEPSPLGQKLERFACGRKLLALAENQTGKSVAELLEAWFGEVPDDEGIELLKTEKTQLEKLLKRVVLLTEGDVEKVSYFPQAVTLLTLHAAKGLEFPVVFISGVEDGLLPLGDDIEEERRLFYVGITRARDQLILLRSKTRVRNGGKRLTKPSPFLLEISKNLINHEEICSEHQPRQLSLF
jgi:uncharacterized protein (TIGR00375 family)